VPLDDTTLDMALLYGLFQTGIKGFFEARRLGLKAEHIQEEERPIFELIETFVRKARMPTPEEVKAKTSIDIEIPEKPYDVDLFANQIVDRALMVALRDGLGPVVKDVSADPRKARQELADLARETAWSTGAVTSYTDASIAQEIKEGYEQAKSRAGKGLLGLSSPWGNVDKHSLGLQPGELTVLLAKRKTGKCIEASTPMMCPTTGQLIPVERFVAEGTRRVLTWKQNQSVHSVQPDAYVDTGTKECLKITWRSGRTLTATPEHPLMTPTGWKRLDELQEGRHTAAVARLPEPLNPAEMVSGMPAFLAYMIAEGGCTKPSTPTFTSNVTAIVDDMAEVTAMQNAMLKPVKDAPGNYYVVIKPYLSVGGEMVSNNFAFDKLREHGLTGKRSIEKTVPERIFSLPNNLLAVFLGRLWSCDGTVEARGAVSYSTGSRKLADQVQHLLLRFGVTSRIRTMSRKIKGGTEERDYYEVIVHRARIENFKRTIGVEMIGPKAEKLQHVLFQGRSRVGWIRNEELRDEIRSEMDARPDLLKSVGEELGYGFKFQKGHVFDSKSGRIRRKVFEAFCEVYDSPLKWVLDENIDWDEVVMIEPVGVKRVFDLTVLPTSCFVANDVIVHNTWLLLAWMVHILRNDLKPGESILIVSMEMPRKAIYRRMAAIDLKLCYKDFREGTLTVEEEKRLDDWVEDMMTEDPTRPTIHVACADTVSSTQDICDKVAEHNPRCVGIDGMYILGRDKKQSMWERTITNCSEIKIDLCTGMNIAVLATTQFKGTMKKDALDADADDAAYAKAIGDWADAMRAAFMNSTYEKDKKRVFRALESREFQGVDLLINFNLDTMDFSEIKIMDAPDEEEGTDTGDDPHDDDHDPVTPAIIDGSGAGGELTP
jgi:replicative DNA helicase